MPITIEYINAQDSRVDKL